MISIQNNILNFFNMLTWKVIVAGFIMTGIILLIITLLFVVIRSFQNRKEAIKVSLPDMDSYNDENIGEAQFKEVDKMLIELIESDDDVISVVDEDNKAVNETVFLTALSVATGKYISNLTVDVEMPEVGEVDYKALLSERRELAAKRAEQTLAHLKEVAEADEQAELSLEESITADIITDTITNNLGDGAI